MKRPLFLLLALLVSLMMSAQRITEEQALVKAQQFMQGKVFKQHRNVRRVNGNTLPAAQSLYIFNVEENGGFVIVSGNESTEVILGYATRGNINEEQLSPNFRAWLNQMAIEIEANTTLSRQAPSYDIPQSMSLRRAVAIHDKVEPLIQTEWNQGNKSSNSQNTDGVYNIHLPKKGERYPCTGCVATAGAQVMNYYQWPKTATQVVPGYDVLDNEGNVVATGFKTQTDLPAIEFQWDKMKTQYVANDPDAEAVNAVADLMLYCGFAAHMHYGVDGSSASTSTLAKGMAKYFDYSDSWKDVNRYQYTISEWDELIYNELAAGRPVIYSGSYDGGHAFICDGYDGDGMYHFNWGWGGSGNGYFKLQATNPYGANNLENMGYIADNYCIIGLQPSSWPAIEDPNEDDTWEIEEIEGIVATADVVSVEDGEVTMWCRNYNEEKYGFGFGIGELNSDGTITPVDISKEEYKNTLLDYGWGYSALMFDFASYNLPEGTHTLVPISLLNGEEEWKRCKPADLYFNIEVAGGQTAIEAHPIVNLVVNEFELVKSGEPNTNQAVRMNITNKGDNLEKRLYLFIGTTDNVGDYKRKNIRIAAGNTKEYRMWIGSLDAGTYTLRLATDDQCNHVIAQKDITIVCDLEATNFDVVGKKYVNRILRIDATVENHAGDYGLPLYLFANTTETKTFAYAAGSAIEEGGSDVVSFYFQPDKAGTWNLWVATDKDGKNIIGQTTVDIEDTHEANLTGKIQVQNLFNNVIKAEKMVLEVNITNEGEYTYDDVIEAVLYKLTPDGNSGTWVETQEQELTLEPMANTSLKFAFDNLEDGSKYFCWVYYYSKGTAAPVKGTPSYLFNYTPEPDILIGDVNDDGTVDISDYIGVANHILGNTPAGFNETAADVNNDGSIDISDYIGVANIILTGKP